MNGAEAILQCLKSEGVEVVFGYPGGQVIPLYDALHKVDIRHVLVRNEQGAAFMAGGYARATGKVGVAFATSGPGATNLVTGIADAHMDSIPVVFITGQVPHPMIGRDSFQEADVTGITLPIVKHSYLVQTVEELPWVLHEAFHIARSGRPGPVLVDVPKDIQVAKLTVPLEVASERLRGPSSGLDIDSAQLDAAAEVINASAQPTLYVGGGSLNAAAELRAFAEKTGIPVTWTLMGKGAFPEDHPLSVGMLGMHGAAYANYAITRCDTMIVLGARFDDRVTGKLATFNPEARVVHIDIDAAELGKNRIPTAPVQGDVAAALRALTVRCEPRDRSAWAKRVTDWKESFPLVAHKAMDTGEIRPQHLLDKLTQATAGRAIVATDVGQHQMWTAQFYHPAEPRLFLTSGGLGTMGFGLPAAIGAWFACPEKEVWLVTGDGSIQMNIQELAVAVIEKVPLRIMLINNGYLGMVRQWQELFFERNYSETWLHTVPNGSEVISPDFCRLMEAYGGQARRVTADADVEAAIDWAREVDGPVLLEFVVHEEENVWPMVPAGGDTGKPILEPEGGE
ncbi:MAG: biosynthetic-type acetolactate synthase large subunit [Armatimonadetes bacterium]|nr:biosynthetic-type acetolactate synthase large subunit [Armatimonadota bacterium]